MIRYGVAVILVSLALVSCAFGAPVEGAWSEPVGGLQSRIILDRAIFKAGERIDARVEVKNVGDKPVAVTRAPGASGESLAESPWGFEVTTPSGKPAVDISAWFQTAGGFDLEAMKKNGPPPQPMLEPGKTIVFAAGLEDYYYLGRPGRYSIRWKGAPPMLSARDQWEEEIHMMDWNQPEREPRKPTVPAIPATPAVQFDVQPGAPDPVGPLLDILPPGWRLGLSYTRSRPSLAFGPRDQVQPPGRKAANGACVTLTHYPLEGMLTNNTGLTIYITDAPAEPDPASKDKPALDLGKGRFGHVYLWLREGRDAPSPEARWHHLRYDVATALGVTNPAPAKPAGPDWGRMMCAILKACADEHLETRDHFPFCDRAVVHEPEEHRTLGWLEFHYNQTTDERETNVQSYCLTRKDLKKPYYSVYLGVAPLPGNAVKGRVVDVDRALNLSATSDVAAYEAKRLGVRFIIRVDTDDDDFRKKLDAILDREVTRVLAAEPVAKH